MAREPVSVPRARSSGYCSPMPSVEGASSSSSRARSAASETSGMPVCEAATAASLRSLRIFGLRAGGGAQMMTVGRVWTMRRRTESAKAAGSPVASEPVPATSQASRAAYSMVLGAGRSARTRGSRRGGFRSSIGIGSGLREGAMVELADDPGEDRAPRVADVLGVNEEGSAQRLGEERSGMGIDEA